MIVRRSSCKGSLSPSLRDSLRDSRKQLTQMTFFMTLFDEGQVKTTRSLLCILQTPKRIVSEGLRTLLGRLEQLLLEVLCLHLSLERLAIRDRG